MHAFDVKLAFSRGQRELTDMETLRTLIPGCVSVIKTPTETDKTGVDYIASLRRGAEIWIDAKTRELGASRFWRNGPELALEIWSVRPNGKYSTPREQAKVGWTLCEANQVDMILYTFDASDSEDVFLVPFQHLRMAFQQNFSEWSVRYHRKNQDSFQWESQCIFVPADIVLKAIDSIIRCRRSVPAVTRIGVEN